MIGERAHSCDIRMIDPWLKDKRANTIHDNNSVMVCSCNRFDEVVTVVPCC